MSLPWCNVMVQSFTDELLFYGHSRNKVQIYLKADELKREHLQSHEFKKKTLRRQKIFLLNESSRSTGDSAARSLLLGHGTDLFLAERPPGLGASERLQLGNSIGVALGRLHHLHKGKRKWVGKGKGEKKWD